MRPVRPLLFMGRAAKRVPPTPVQEAVFDFFKASGIHLGKGINRKPRKIEKFKRKLLSHMLTRLPACLLACVPACLRACVPACLPARLPARPPAFCFCLLHLLAELPAASSNPARPAAAAAVAGRTGFTSALPLPPRFLKRDQEPFALNQK